MSDLPSPEIVAYCVLAAIAIFVASRVVRFFRIRRRARALAAQFGLEIAGEDIEGTYEGCKLSLRVWQPNITVDVPDAFYAMSFSFSTSTGDPDPRPLETGSDVLDAYFKTREADANVRAAVAAYPEHAEPIVRFVRKWSARLGELSMTPGRVVVSIRSGEGSRGRRHLPASEAAELIPALVRFAKDVDRWLSPTARTRAAILRADGLDPDTESYR